MLAKLYKEKDNVILQRHLFNGIYYGSSAPLKDIPLQSILKLLCYKVVDILMRVVRVEKV